jgi:hypothetical protein
MSNLYVNVKVHAMAATKYLKRKSRASLEARL